LAEGEAFWEKGTKGKAARGRGCDCNHKRDGDVHASRFCTFFKVMRKLRQ